MSRDTPIKEVSLDEKRWRRRNFLSFLVFIVMIGVAVFGWGWLRHQPKDSGALRPLRKALVFNESIFGSLFSSGVKAPTYELKSAAPRARVNGPLGTRGPVDGRTWRLNVIRKPGDTLKLALGDIWKLPYTRVTFNFKCIEGWSQVTSWGGVRLSTFLKAYGLDSLTRKNYIGFETPDHGYYVGIDMPSALQDQTILCYALNGKALPLDQGYPLRLIIPVKYGIKHIKRIGFMSFSDTKPRDYWAEQGYDYYSGL